MGLIARTDTVQPPNNPPAQTSPSLFDDYGDNAFAGEAGALAVNDAWASTVYDYFPQFAPTIPTLPEPTGSPAKPGSSGVNPNAADEFLVIDRAGLATALNNATYQFIFLAKGSDCTDGGDNDLMTLTTSGSSGAGNQRWFIYWDDATPGNVQDIKPWNQAYVDRVQVPRIVHSNASYTWWVGLSFGDLDTPKLGTCASFTNGSSNNQHYRCNMENGTIHVWNCVGSSGDNNRAYQCVNGQHQTGTGDVHSFVVQGGSGHRIISCEGWDILGDFFQVESGGADDCVVEDCDIYRETFYDGNGNIDINGAFGKGEGGIDCKKLNPDATSTLKAYGNRIWGMRPRDPIAHPGGGNGQPLSFAVPSINKRGLDARWNVFFDCTEGAFDLRNMIPGTNKDHSIVRNIIADIKTTSDKPVFYLPMDTTEVYLNTVTDCLSGAATLWYNFRSDTSDIDVHDTMGNFFQDTGTFLNQGQWGTSWKWGYNAYAGTYTTESKTYPIGYEAASKAALNMGNFTFKRKKMTGPENFTINGIVPTTSTPTAFKTLVPTSGGDQIGSRTGIGVDDLF